MWRARPVWVWLAAVLCFFVCGEASFAQVLDTVDVSTENGDAVIEARFSTPVQYLRHFPLESGEILQIYLRVSPIGPTDPSPGLNVAPRETKSYRPRPVDGLPLREVTFEENGAEGTKLIVHFQRPVRYSVKSTPDQRSILIRVPLEHPVQAAPPGAGPLFVVDLATLDRPPRSRPALPEDLAGKVVYAIPFVQGAQTRFRLRMGFFNSREEAERARKLLKQSYPKSRIGLVNSKEREEAQQLALPPPRRRQRPAPAPPAAPAGPPRPQAPAAGDDRVAAETARLIAAGRAALTKGDNVKAVRIFTQALSLPANRYSADAQELLGLAYERNKQIELAKVEYKLYLKSYPDAEGAERVRQRLAVLEPGSESVELRAPKRKEREAQTDFYGTFAQNYFRSESDVVSRTTGATPTETRFSQVEQSSLVTHLDAIARYRSTHYDNRVVFSGDHLYDFLNKDKSDSRISSAYVDINNRLYEASARMGRQSGNARGVLGRFDGGLFGYNFLPKWRTNVVVGQPVDTIAPGSDRKFTGIDLAMGPFKEKWGGSLYYIQQDVDDFTDRQAAGTELRYFSPTSSLFSLVDYDTYFQKLNIALVQANWQRGKTSFNLLADYRMSPPLQLTNALQGETATSVKQLAQTMSEEQIKDLALSRTAESRIFVLGAVRPFNSKWQVGGDITYTNISDSSLGQGTGNIYTYNLQLIGNSTLFKDDVSVIATSYTDGRDFEGAALSLVNRVPIGSRWRLETSLRLYRQDNAVGTTVERVTPDIKFDYKTTKHVTLEGELGYERSRVTGLDRDEDTDRTFFMLGYRWDF